MTDDERREILTAARVLIAQNRADDRARELEDAERAFRGELPLEAVRSTPPAPSPPPPPPSSARSAPGLSPDELRRVERWIDRSIKKESLRMSTPTLTTAQVNRRLNALAEAIGEIVAGERKAVNALAAEVQELKAELATLRGEIAVRVELDQMRQQLAVLRSDPKHIIDLPGDAAA